MTKNDLKRDGRRPCLALFAAFAIALFLGVLRIPASAQTTSTTILGTVADSTGAVVAGAKAMIVNTKTAVRREDKTTSTGVTTTWRPDGSTSSRPA